MTLVRMAVLVAVLAGSSAAAPPRTASTQAPDPAWLEWNPATRTMRFKLVAGMTGRGAKSPFNFNGYTDGELRLVAPVDANVIISFTNEDGTPHSAVVIADTEPMPNMAENAAIQRAYTSKALEGLGYFATDVMRFKAAPAGAYRIFCGVPGHGLSGMWIRFAVDSGAPEPQMAEFPTNR